MLSGDQVDRGCAQGVQIGRREYAGTVRLLGGGVSGRIDVGRRAAWHGALDDGLDGAEIDQEDAAVSRAHDVFGLDVAVDDRLRQVVQVLESFEHRDEHCDDGFFLEGAQLVQILPEVLSRNVGLDQIEAARLFKVAEELRNAVVDQALEDLRLAFERLDRLRVGQGQDEFFENNQAPSFLIVFDQVSGPKATQTERALHDEPVLEYLPGGQAGFDAPAAREAHRGAHGVGLPAVGAGVIHRGRPRPCWLSGIERSRSRS